VIALYGAGLTARAPGAAGAMDAGATRTQEGSQIPFVTISLSTLDSLGYAP